MQQRKPSAQLNHWQQLLLYQGNQNTQNPLLDAAEMTVAH